jgi:hypothetical protein
MERTRRYRVTSDDPNLVDVDLRMPGRPPAPGQLLELGDESALVRFAQPGAPPVAIGERVVLHLASKLSPQEIEIPAAARLCREERYSRLVDFEFSRAAASSRPVRLSLLSLLDRRVTFRVRPALPSPIEVVLSAGRRATRRGTAVDVSETGLGVWVRGRSEGPLAGHCEVGIAFRLPTCRDAHDLRGSIRTRASSGEGIRYGIEFEREKSANFDRQREAIRRYMAERQREILRMGVRAEG